MPRVSVIMNCYNGERYLREAIDSVYAQTYTDWEIILWDDASADSTGDIAQSYDSRLHYFRGEKAKSLGQARNFALKKAKGEYIAFLDQDDIWFPKKIEKQIEIIDSDKDAAFVYTNFCVLGSNDRRYLKFKGSLPEGNVFRSFLRYYPVGILAVMVRSSFLFSLDELFDETLRLCEEYELFMRLLFSHKAMYIHEPLAGYRMHADMTGIKHMAEYPAEYEYVIEKFKRVIPGFTKEYAPEINYLKAKIGYWNARAEMTKGNQGQARFYLGPYKFVDYKFFFLYLSSFFPSTWNMLHRIGSKGFFG